MFSVYFPSNRNIFIAFLFNQVMYEGTESSYYWHAQYFYWTSENICGTLGFADLALFVQPQKLKPQKTFVYT